MKIVCIKYGDKFSFEHVNRLYRMVKKNFKEKFDFYCHTENSKKIYEDIKIVPLPKEWEEYKTEDYPYWVKLHSFFEQIQGANLDKSRDRHGGLRSKPPRLSMKQHRQWPMIKAPYYD